MADVPAAPAGPDGTVAPARQDDRQVTLPRGVRLGVDVGTVRVGVARSDPDGLVATPETTVAHVPGRHTDVAAVAALAAQAGASVVYVGLPRTLAGGEGESARRAREFATGLLGSTQTAAGGPDIEVRLVDERLTTVDAARQLRDSGRRARAQRQVIDQAAAVLILQVALDHERSTGRRAGATPAEEPGPVADARRAATPIPDRPRKARHRGRGADARPGAAVEPDDKDPSP
ncbi:Holliday junction resolvase RuvX [Arsenicicoccus cauae]|uniref:Holliday junction resolvase RuvX n=1 Tax=Arsenicicoccus cauae TaxID=2663847 RepID=UPI00370DA2A0